MREFPVLDLFLPMMVSEQAHLDRCGDLSMLKLYGSLDEGQEEAVDEQRSDPHG